MVLVFYFDCLLGQLKYIDTKVNKND